MTPESVYPCQCEFLPSYIYFLMNPLHDSLSISVREDGYLLKMRRLKSQAVQFPMLVRSGMKIIQKYNH